MKQVPDIALVATVRIDHLTGRAQRIAAITHGRVPFQTAILSQPHSVQLSASTASGPSAAATMS